ncbi:MAG: cadherin-like beta sandwich domain-containing protein [Eubacterium sp.]|nr:cadherin-like beta sandwich domain-containing protein [Eubacterium sp.]
MRKKKSKQLLLAALTGMLVLSPIQQGSVPETVQAAQGSAAHDSKLSAFDIAPGVLSPAFSPDITEYTSTVNADVTSVSVQAVPRASGAVIASVEGRDGLRPGVNTIKVTCSAQDNTFTVYTITLTVGSADAGAQAPESDAAPDAGGTQPDNGTEGTAAGSDTSTDPGAGTAAGSTDTQLESDGPNDTDGSPSDSTDGGSQADGAGDTNADTTSKKRSLAARLSAAVKADGTVKLSGAAYKLSSGFTYGATTQDIPSAFGQGSLQIGDNSYSTLYCEQNGVNLVYMENTDGNGATGFYYYDEIKNRVERFKYMGSGEQFVVFISNARQELPTGYQEKTLKLPSGKKAAAYQSLYADELKDYYLVYGIYSDGSDGWYLYDKKQDTYMRYSNAFASAQGMQEDDSGEEELERTVSLTKYNTLNEKYTELKENRVKIVSVLVVAIVLLIIIFTALLLRSRDDEEDGAQADSRERSKKKKTPRARKQTEAISKSSLAAGRNFEGGASKKAKKVTKTFTQEPLREMQEQSAVRNAVRDNISSPEEIRAQVSREQGGSMRQGFGQSQFQSQYPGMEKAPQMRSAQPVSQGAPQMRGAQPASQGAPRMPQAGSSPDSVQMAAERMRQSVRYPRPAKAEAAEPEHDPMDDWDMEEAASRRQPKAGKAARKKRGYIDDDMEIMDLNDL